MALSADSPREPASAPSPLPPLPQAGEGRQPHRVFSSSADGGDGFARAGEGISPPSPACGRGGGGEGKAHDGALILEHIRRNLALWPNASALRIAFSGGLDSTVLLHALARLAKQEKLPPLSAIHIAHGLQAVAEDWPQHCQAFCQALGIDLQIILVKVDKTAASLERAAREARHSAFAQQLKSGELLLLAQHQDDQAETLLLRLLRGAGVRGLAGMPKSRPLGQGHLLRPLLNCSRQMLENYAKTKGLSWIEDPSNQDTRFARNHLRQSVLPKLREQWPAASTTIARASENLSEAQQLLDELAQSDLACAQTPSPWSWLKLPSLELAPLLELSEARQRNALRHFLAPLTLLPDNRHLAGWQALKTAAADANPIWKLQGGELHRAFGRIYWLCSDWLQPLATPPAWHNPKQPLALPGNGMVQLIGEPPLGALSIRYRNGGERLSLAQGTQDLKRLLNESRIPTFIRPRLPLLFCEEKLLAVVNLPLSTPRPLAGEGQGRGRFTLHWQLPTVR